MRYKKAFIPVIAIGIMTAPLSGCNGVNSKDMLELINNGESIVLEVAKPAYEIKTVGTKQDKIPWIQLDVLKSYNEFRQEIDEIFNINIVSVNGVHGKSGCLYVDETGDRNGNTTLEDALRNKVFNKKYWDNQAVRAKIAAAASKIYTDINENSEYMLLGAINAYWNLLPNAKDPAAFNGSQSLTREEFYTLVFKSEEGVRVIDIDEGFQDAIGGETSNSRYAQEVDEYGFLSVKNKSLDSNSYKGSISRAEAIYMMVNKHFKEEFNKVTGKEKAFKDTKNAGDLALKAGFKYKDKATKETLCKDRWQSYTLAYMFQHPDTGMQEEIYKAMVVAHNLRLIEGEESRWDEPISKAEAIKLIINTHLAKNNLYGYNSVIEYGATNRDKFKVNTESLEVLGTDEEGYKYGEGWVEVDESTIPADPNKKLKSGYTLLEAKMLIEASRKSLAEKEMNEGLKNDILENQALALGTTLKELERVEMPKEVAKETPSQPSTSTSTSKPSTSKPSTSKPSTSKPSEPNPFDKNGNGIDDELEPYIRKGGEIPPLPPGFEITLH